eukprot:g8328.t1
MMLRPTGEREDSVRQARPQARLAAQECFLDQRLALRAVFDSTTLPSTSSSLSSITRNNDTAVSTKYHDVFKLVTFTCLLLIFLIFPAGCSNYSCLLVPMRHYKGGLAGSGTSTSGQGKLL